MRKNRFAFGLSVFLFLLVSGSSQATQTDKISIYPTNFEENNPKSRSWFILSLWPGQKISREVTIHNKGEETVELQIYGVDASANNDGAFTLKEKNVREEVGGWIKLPVKIIVVPPNSKISVPFTIEVPTLASPGDHVGGIAVEEINRSDLSTSGVKLIKRIGVRVYASITGQKFESLEIKSLRFTQAANETYLYYTVNNTGNTNLSLKGTVELKSVLGSTSYNPGPLGEILAGKQVTAKIAVKGTNALTYSAGINFIFGKTGQISKHTFFFSKSIIFGLLLFPITFILVIIARRQSRIAWKKTTH